MPLGVEYIGERKAAWMSLNGVAVARMHAASAIATHTVLPAHLRYRWLGLKEVILSSNSVTFSVLLFAWNLDCLESGNYSILIGEEPLVMGMI